METRLIALLISGLVFASYCIFNLYKFGVTKSISITYYKLQKSLRWLFTVFMVSWSIPMSIAGNTPLMWFACSCMILTGVAADGRRDKMTERLHIIGVNTGIIAGYVSVWADYGYWWLAVMGLIGTILMLGKVFTDKLEWRDEIDNHTWYIEIYHFIILSSGIYLNIAGV